MKPYRLNFALKTRGDGARSTGGLGNVTRRKRGMMKFVKLHVKGEPIFVNLELVIEIRQIKETEFSSWVSYAVSARDGDTVYLLVDETPEEILAHVVE